MSALDAFYPERRVLAQCDELKQLLMVSYKGLTFNLKIFIIYYYYCCIFYGTSYIVCLVYTHILHFK